MHVCTHTHTHTHTHIHQYIHTYIHTYIHIFNLFLFFFLFLQCSVTCGKGSKSREITCRSKTLHGQILLPDSMCQPQPQPRLTRPCRRKPCHKPKLQWVVSSWNHVRIATNNHITYIWLSVSFCLSICFERTLVLCFLTKRTYLLWCLFAIWSKLQWVVSCIATNNHITYILPSICFERTLVMVFIAIWSKEEYIDNVSILLI